jgi:hypothetical protein
VKTLTNLPDFAESCWRSQVPFLLVYWIQKAVSPISKQLPKDASSNMNGFLQAAAV